MVKGLTNFRKASGKRFKKRKCPRRSSLTSSTNESEVETIININETADNNHEGDGEISGPSTALPTVPVSEKKLAGTTEKMFDVDSKKEYLPNEKHNFNAVFYKILKIY